MTERPASVSLPIFKRRVHFLAFLQHLPVVVSLFYHILPDFVVQIHIYLYIYSLVLVLHNPLDMKNNLCVDIYTYDRSRRVSLSWRYLFWNRFGFCVYNHISGILNNPLTELTYFYIQDRTSHLDDNYYNL